jgi:UDP-N-acetylmuramate--alanine ligase
MKHVHLIGIGGAGLSALASLLAERGYQVSGSDQQDSAVTALLRTSGIPVYSGHRPENVYGADVVVRSSAVRDDNVEVLAAKHAGIPVLKRADFLAELLADRDVIAIAGTHGKTTTTAMIAWILTRSGQDPSYLIGGMVTNLGRNARAGNGKAFVIEADEYDRMFLGIRPRVAVVTNVEYDHPDCFPNPQDLHLAFKEFVGNLDADGVLVVCREDQGALNLLKEAARLGRQTRIYGLKADEHGQVKGYHAENLHVSREGGLAFTAYHDGHFLAEVSLQIPGEHNARNALAAIAVTDLLGLPVDEAAEALGEFTGTGRRFEVKGEANGIVVIDDYAHHPTEIKATLAAARLRYPGRRIVAVWQPHTVARTRALFDDFTRAFSEADYVLVTEVYAAREPRRGDFSAKKVVEAMDHPQVRFVAESGSAIDILSADLRPGDILLVMSAGDATNISKYLLATLVEERSEENA